MNYHDFTRLPEVLLDGSKNAEYVELLSESFIQSCDMNEIKRIVRGDLKLLNDFKYIVGASSVLVSSKVDSNRVSSTRMRKDNVGDYVANLIDLEDAVCRTAEALTTVASKLTEQEAEYLVLAYFKHLSEEKIAERLNVCRKTLQHMKNSALLKVYLEMKRL